MADHFLDLRNRLAERLGWTWRTASELALTDNRRDGWQRGAVVSFVHPVPASLDAVAELFAPYANRWIWTVKAISESNFRAGVIGSLEGQMFNTWGSTELEARLWMLLAVVDAEAAQAETEAARG